MTIQELALQGKHNIYNSMAASIAARVFEVKDSVIRKSLIGKKPQPVQEQIAPILIAGIAVPGVAVAIVAGFIALGAGAMVIAGVALITIGAGLLIMSKAYDAGKKMIEPVDGKPGLVSILDAVASGFTMFPWTSVNL